MRRKVPNLELPCTSEPVRAEVALLTLCNTFTASGPSMDSDSDSKTRLNRETRRVLTDLHDHVDNPIPSK